jgi:heat shock protein HtpX
MSDLAEHIVHALEKYWSSPVPLAVTFGTLACIGTLVYVFLTNARNAKLRVSLLTGLYSLSIFFWGFMALSIAFCLGMSSFVAYNRVWGVPLAASGAVLTSLALSAGVSVVVWRRGAEGVLRRIPTRAADAREKWLADYIGLVSRFESLPAVELRIKDDDKPLAMAVSGRRDVVIVSTGLLSALDRDEVESVVTHELMHIKNHDSRFKVFSTVMSRFMFFDPFSKFFDPAVHREREYLADEMSGRTTGKPGSLASALLKIHATANGGPGGLAGLSIVGRDRGIFSRFPPVKERISRLILLSEILHRST